MVMLDSRNAWRRDGARRHHDGAGAETLRGGRT